MKLYLSVLAIIAFSLPSFQLLHAQGFQFDSSIEAEEFLGQVLAEFGMDTDDIKIVPSDETSNAEAKVKNELRYIYYNPDWMRDIGSTYNDSEYWLKMGIITHEVGHHIKGHTLTRGGTNHHLELEADWWSGFAMRKFGADLEEALTAANQSTRFATKTHPARRDRLKAVTAGYRNEAYNPPNNDNADYNPTPTDNSRRSSARTVTLGGEPYAIKRFGGLTWMTENLNYQVSDSWCYNNSDSNCRKFGRLYTWDAANRACQAVGWRLPTDQEWRDLAKQYGGVDDDSNDKGKRAFNALKENGSSGLNIGLGGVVYDRGDFRRIGTSGYYWSADGSGKSADSFAFYLSDEELVRRFYDKEYALSCRCVQD